MLDSLWGSQRTVHHWKGLSWTIFLNQFVRIAMTVSVQNNVTTQAFHDSNVKPCSCLTSNKHAGSHEPSALTYDVQVFCILSSLFVFLRLFQSEKKKTQVEIELDPFRYLSDFTCHNPGSFQYGWDTWVKSLLFDPFGGASRCTADLSTFITNVYVTQEFIA